MKINKSEFDELGVYNLTVVRQKEILKRIDQAFYDTIVSMSIDVSWVDYDNGYDESDGHFDVECYSEEVRYDGDIKLKPEFENDFGSFPTRWLWEDTTKEFADIKKSYEDRIEKDVKKKGEMLQKRKEVMESIKGKLSKEELKYIKFIE
jgi:hypothetical protein